MDKIIPQSKGDKKKKEYKPSDFEFMQQLGKGKFGVIFKAKQIQSGQILAIKIIPKKKYEDMQMYFRLKNEIEIQSRLRFTHICLLYCYFHDSMNVYLVMQYCPNMSLYHPIKVENKYFTERQIAKFAYQLLSAVDYLHQRHVIHRDIKLQNLLLDQNYDIKLTDFGCCIHTNEVRRTFCGTLQYIPPQMVMKKDYDKKIDIYCVGIVLYELFYHETPFKAENQRLTLQNITQNSIHFKEGIRMIPDIARDLILQMLWKDPQRRPTARQALKHNFFRYYYEGKVYQPEQLQQIEQKLILNEI